MCMELFASRFHVNELMTAIKLILLDFDSKGGDRRRRK